MWETTPKVCWPSLWPFMTISLAEPALIAKSSIVLDVKPWDDETDMVEMERLVRSIEMDGLLWGKGQLVEIGYGIKKLQIGCVVEDEKVCLIYWSLTRLTPQFGETSGVAGIYRHGDDFLNNLQCSSFRLFRLTE